MLSSEQQQFIEHQFKFVRQRIQYQFVKLERLLHLDIKLQFQLFQRQLRELQPEYSGKLALLLQYDQH